MNGFHVRASSLALSLCLLVGLGLLSASSALAAGPSAPVISQESTTDVTADSATLLASVNPGGAETIYRFEVALGAGGYEVVHGGEGETLTGAEGNVGDGEAGVPVEVHVQGLAAASAYRFRVVASNSVETADGTPATFDTQAIGEFTLPDGRQWEMVSPPVKQGASIRPIGETGVVQASSTGDAITYLTTAPTELELASNTNSTQVLSTRGSGGWSSLDIMTPKRQATGKSVGFGPEYRYFSEDLSTAILQPFGTYTPLSEDASEQTAYFRKDFASATGNKPCVEGCYQPLVTGCPAAGEACAPSIAEHANVPAGTVFGGGDIGKCGTEFAVMCGPHFEGATPDMKHVVLTSTVALTPGATPGMYEWSEGRLIFVGSDSYQGISSDGAVVFFANGAIRATDTVTGETAVLAGESGDVFVATNAEGPAVKMLFIDSKSDLQMCEVITTPGKLGCVDTSLGEGTVGVLGMSKDGSQVYFASNDILTSAANGNGEKAVEGSCLTENSAAGSCNLYAVHETDGHWEAPKLVAVLSAADLPDWRGQEPPRHTARVSPNGEWLAFMSQADLGGYDNRDAVSGHPDEEVYLYNTSTSTLRCASCDPTGARPVGVEYGQINDGLAGGDRVWEHNTWIAANIPGWTPAESGKSQYQSRYLSNSGRLFFNSSDALVPQDVNGAEDVYEYEPPGVGSCGTALSTYSARSGGCVDMISSGSSAEESAFLDASEDGGDVFFLTAARLVEQDFDTSLDVYDAHECTAASPCPPLAVPLPPPCTTGDACKPAPTPQPAIFGEPASATFSGAGNVSPASQTVSVKPKTVKAKTLTREQKLARALKACSAKKPHRKRATCEREARKRYAAKATGKSKAKQGGK